ncbi:MAG: glycosyltransferase family 39 protein [Candidatus Eisenbacteria bacterium]|jgi:hypothetical protein|nr:glycosyltransferase family 39 protein [Candidatus Eisenbacteria bacterium]
MTRFHVFTAVLLAIHLVLIVLVPGANRLSDGEIMSLSGGLLGSGELAASLKTGSVMPHPSPFWLSAGLWARVTREPWLLRLPSIMCGLAIIVLITRVGTRHFSRAAGMSAATLYACSPAASGIARTFGPDSGFLLATILAVDAFLSGWKRQGKLPWAILLGALVFMLYWHAYGVFMYLLLWCAFGAVLLWQGKLRRAREPGRPPVGEALVAMGLAGLCYLPWLVLLGRHARMPISPVPVTAAGFYDTVLRNHGSGSIIGFVPLGAAAVVGAILGLRTERVSLSSGRVLLSTKCLLPSFFLIVLSLLFVPGLFAFHRTTVTTVSAGGAAALLTVFLLLAGLGIARLIPHSASAPRVPEFALTLAFGAVLAGIGWRPPAGSARIQAAIWEEAAAHLDGKIRDSDIVLVSPEDAKVFMAWAATKKPWAHLVRGENWLSRYDAGPNMEKVSTLWLCEGSHAPGSAAPQIRLSRLVKTGGLDIGTPEALPYYVDNIDSRSEESDNPRQPFTFSWALAAHAKLNFPLENNRPASAVVFRAASFTLPQKVTIDLNKRRKAQIEMAGGWRHYLAVFEPPEFLPGQRGRIDFHFATHRPSTAPDGTPWRMKAVAFDYVAVFSRQQVAYFPAEAERKEKERLFRREATRVAPMGLQRGGQPKRGRGLSRPPGQGRPQNP